MRHPTDAPSRRHVLIRGAGVAAAAAALVAASRASAAGKLTRGDVKYQLTPNGSQHCGACSSFIPPAGGGAGEGTCKLVDGPIPQNGWCQLFAPRH